MNGVTINDLVLYYDAMKRGSLASPKTFDANAVRLVRFFGDTEPKDIGPAESRAYAVHRYAQGVGPGTVRRELATLSAMCQLAVRDRILGRESLPVLERPENPPARDRWLTEEELCILLSAAQELRVGERLSRLERFLWLAIMTAARFDAILRLEWGQVDFATNIIHLNPPGRKQTKKRRADVAMSEELRAVMEAAYAQRESEKVLDTTRDIRGLFKRCVEASKLEGVTPHVLRHTAATHMRRRGVPIATIAGVLGITVSVAERVYAHHAPEFTQDAVNQIPSPVRSAV